jgi:hypothetical protein
MGEKMKRFVSELKSRVSALGQIAVSAAIKGLGDVAS